MTKYLFQISFLMLSFNGFGQQDKTTNWVLPQKGSEYIIIGNTSPKVGTYFYEQVYIKPNTVKNLHVVVGSENLNSAGFKNETFAVQIFSRKKTWVSIAVKDDYMYKANIPLDDTDTVAVRISIDAVSKIKKKFFVEYIMADTAAMDYSNLTPQACFEKMLQMASSGFINLPAHEKFYEPQVTYDKGLFAPYYARRGGYGDVKQNIGEKTKSVNEANAACEKWNKQITMWLKDYNVTDISKKITGKVDEHTDKEETTYTKKNAAGKLLFTVTVYKEVLGSGSSYNYQTGVIIEN